MVEFLCFCALKFVRLCGVVLAYSWVNLVEVYVACIGAK